MPQSLDLSRLPVRSDQGTTPTPGPLDLSRLPVMAEEPSTLTRGLAMGARIVPAVGGAMLGSFGGPLGTVAGGAIGAGVGETLGQLIEGRDDLNLPQIATQTAIGAIPIPGAKAGSSLLRAAAGQAGKGAVLGGVSAGATQAAEGQDITPGAVALGAGLGAGLGGAAGAAGARALRGVTSPRPRAAPLATAADAPVPTRTPGLSTNQVAFQNAADPVPAQVPLTPDEAVRRFNLKTMPEEIRGELGEEITRLSSDLAEQVRGVQPVERSLALGRQMLLDAGKALPKGTAANAETLAAYGQAVGGAQQLATDAAKRYAANPNVKDELAMLVANQQRDVLVQSFRGLSAEAGRALNTLKHLKALQPIDAMTAQQILEQGGAKARTEVMARLLRQTPDDPAAAYQAFQQLSKTGWGDTIGSYYATNLLSGNQTYSRNAIGTAFKALTRPMVKVTAGGFDAVRSTLTGKERTVFPAEAAADVAGAMFSLQRGLADGWYTLRHGFSAEAARLGQEIPSALDTPRVQFRWGSKNPMNYPGRLLDATDRVFYTINKGAAEMSEALAAAKRQAASKSFTSAEARVNWISEKATEIRLSPTPAFQERVHKEALESVFREDMGKLGRSVATALNVSPEVLDKTWLKGVRPLRMFVPFIRTVSNLTRQGLEHSPYGFAKAASLEDPRKAALMRGQAALGTATMGLLMSYVTNGFVSGSGPADPAERAKLLDSGWRPNSIFVPSIGWVNYSLAQPLAFPLSVMANGWETLQDLKDDETAATEIGIQTAARVANSVLDQSFLSGAFAVVEALQSPEQHARRFFERFVQGFVPMSGLLRNITKMTDPVIRDPRGIAESIQSIIPFLSEQVPPRLNAFGEAIQRNEIAPGLLIPEISPERRESVNDALLRTGVRVQTRQPSELVIGNQTLPLTDAEGRAVVRFKGQTLKSRLKSFTDQPGFARLPLETQVQILETVKRRTGSETSQVIRGLKARGAMLDEIIDARRQFDAVPP